MAKINYAATAKKIMQGAAQNAVISSNRIPSPTEVARLAMANSNDGNNVVTDNQGPSPTQVARIAMADNKTNFENTNNGLNLYDQLLLDIQNRTASKFDAFPTYQKAAKSAAERAGLMVNGKYDAQASGINRAIQKNDQDLQLGVTTQNNYAQIGDAKLQKVYGDLNSVAKESAGRVNALYSNAKDNVTKTYTDAQAEQAQTVKQTNADVAADANALGLSNAIEGATVQLRAYQDGAKAQTSVDKANSIANIITLGANMGAAAEKDMVNLAQLGADSRRDLVTSVQSTIANLQRQHDSISGDLQSQLASLEAQRASELQSVTYQIEADDIDKQYQYEKQKAQYEADNARAVIQQQDKNLSDMLSILKAQRDDSDSYAAQQATLRTADLAERKFNYDSTRQNLQDKLDISRLSLDEQKLIAETKNKETDNQRQAAVAAENVRHNKEIERINALQYLTETQRNALKDAEDAKYKQATLKLSQDTLAFNKSNVTADNNRADEALALNKQKAADDAKTKQDKIAAEAANKVATDAKRKLELEKLQLQITALKNKTPKKLPTGLPGLNAAGTKVVSKDLKKYLTDIVLVDPSVTSSKLVGTTPYDAAMTIVLQNNTMTDAEKAAAANAIQIYYGKK